MDKLSITERILRDAANHVVSERGQYINECEDELILPDNPHERTVAWYVSVLDRACRVFFEYGNDDKLFEILQDAKKNNVRIKEYNSIPTKRFSTYNVDIKKATLFWEKGKNPKVRIYTISGSILITKSEVNPKGKIKFSERLKKVVHCIQESLAKIEELL